MKKLALVIPNKSFYHSYLSLVTEFIDNQEKLVPFPLSYANDDIEVLFNRFDNDSRGINIEGFVPNTTYWLIEDDFEVVAVSNLRHSLNEKLLIEGGHIGYGVRPSVRRRGFGKEILRLTLEQARKINLTKVLVTCNKENLGSTEIILANGGVYDSEEYVESYGGVVQRFWIVL